MEGISAVMSIGSPAAVIEIGSHHTKVGFAGEACPRHIFQTPAYGYITNLPAANHGADCCCRPIATTAGTALGDSTSLTSPSEACETLLHRIFFT